MKGARRKVTTAGLAGAVLALLPAAAANAADKDIIGLWTGGVIWGQANAIALNQKGELTPNSYGAGNTTERTSFAGQYSGGERFIISEQDPGVAGRANDNVPLYRPEVWSELELTNFLHKSDPTGERMDPRWRNLPIGVPALGAPQAILAGPRPNELFFIYQAENQWRYIPTDCRAHDESLTYDAQFNGHSVGCWEGNTLVVTSKGFTTDSWIWRFGGFHTADMVVTERFTPNAQGTQIAYTRTVHDPKVLLQDWNMGTQTLNRNTNAKAFIREDYPYNNLTQGDFSLELGGGC
jgi:hypothetical protein